MGCLCRPLSTNWLAHRLTFPYIVTGKTHRLRKVVNSGTRLCSYIPETKNVVVQGKPLRASYVLNTGNGKHRSLKMVSESPQRKSSVWTYRSRRSSSRSFLERSLTTLLRSYPASSASGIKNTQIKGLKFVSSFRRDLRCSLRFKIFSMRLVIAYWTLTGFSSARSSLEGFDLRPVSSHSIKPLSSLASNPFKGWSGLTLLHDDPLPASWERRNSPPSACCWGQIPSRKRTTLQSLDV